MLAAIQNGSLGSGTMPANVLQATSLRPASSGFGQLINLMAQGRERTKEQLYREAKRLGVKGRSKMNKGQLKAAVDRRS